LRDFRPAGARADHVKQKVGLRPLGIVAEAVLHSSYLYKYTPLQSKTQTSGQRASRCAREW